MVLRLCLYLLFIPVLTFGQTQDQNDSLVNVLCNTINLKSNPSDSSNIESALKKHLFPYLLKYPENQSKAIIENIALRLQRNCDAFLKFSNTLSPQKGDWQALSEWPKSKLTKSSCDTFFAYKNYKYLEVNGDTVRLQIENGYWLDHFQDGTYSKLKFVRINDCEFEIEFIESNNIMRANFSKVGDKYRYQLVEKNGTKYLLTTQIMGSKGVYSFIIYY